MDQRDWLFMVETVFLYGGLMAFGLWQVWKMKRDLAEIRSKKATKAAETKHTTASQADETEAQAVASSTQGDSSKTSTTETRS